MMSERGGALGPSEIDEFMILEIRTLQPEEDALGDDTDEQFFKMVVRCYSKMRA